MDYKLKKSSSSLVLFFMNSNYVSIGAVFVFQKLIFKKALFKFSCVYSLLKKLVNEKHFPEVVKNLEMSYYLLIISNLILKLLIAIYILF
jgi:hypothetical protein